MKKLFTYALALMVFMSACRQTSDNAVNHSEDLANSRKGEARTEVNGYPRLIPEKATVSQINTIDSKNLETRARPVEEQVNELIISEVKEIGRYGDNQLLYVETSHNTERIQIGQEKLISLDADNDLWGNTDYYYTNGFRLTIMLPAFSFLPTSKALPGTGIRGIDHYGFSIVQNIYTPIDPDNYEIQYGDRPFAGYLYASFLKISNNANRKLRLSSEIAIGVIGPAAMGGSLQKSVHQIEPVGWDNQVTNDIVLNYNIRLDKALISTNLIELSVATGAQVGSLYDNLSAGLQFRLGRFNPLFNAISLTNNNFRRHKKILYHFLFAANNRFIGYDATLQGGLFNNTSVYTISANNISRYVFNASVGIGIGIGRIGFRAEQYFLTPEFKGGKNHIYGKISIDFRI